MDQLGCIIFNIAFLMGVSVQADFRSTSNFRYKRDEPIKLAHHLYLTSTKCKTPIQCAVACMCTPGCVLADLVSGNLYKKSQSHILETRDVHNYVESQEEGLDETKSYMSFLMVATRGSSEVRDVYKVSMNSNTTEKTGITVNTSISSFTYDKISKTVFWSETSGIYKFVMVPHPIKQMISNQKRTSQLNMFNEKLVYVINKWGQGGTIFTHDPKKMKSDKLWLSLKKVTRIESLVIDGNIGCLVELDIAVNFIRCFEMSSKKKIFYHRLKSSATMTLLVDSNSGLLVYTEKYAVQKFYVKAVRVSLDGQFGEGKTIHQFEGYGTMRSAPGLLLYSRAFTNTIEVWEMSQNGSVGNTILSTHCPSSGVDSTLLVTFL